MVGTTARIFLNYRRSDSAGWARQLHSDLSARFGAERIFRDVALEPGVDYIDHLEHVMDTCDVCIPVIGSRWADVTTADGRRRLDEPDDLVRLEIQRALERDDVTVIPVLVDGARMPGEHELPEGLRALARRNACELTDSRWDYDVERLCRGLRDALGDTSVEHERLQLADADADTEKAGGPRTAILLPALATLAAAACAGVLAALLTEPLSGRGDPKWGRLAAYAAERGVIWAIIGAVVTAVVAASFGRVRVPLGHAVVGAGAAGLGGALGGAGLQAMRQFGDLTAADAHWLLRFVLLALPAVALAVVLARAAGIRAAECAVAALAGAIVAALFYPDDRTARLTVHALLVVGPIVALLAARPTMRLARGAWRPPAA